MSENIRSLAKEHHACYEVSPYYVFAGESHGSAPPKSQKIQAGFEVYVYGVNIKDELVFPRSEPDYALGCIRLKKMAEEVSSHASGSCFLEVISFPETIVFDNRNLNTVEGMLTIRISHRRGLDQPADKPEEHALAEVEKQLHGLGVARR